MIGHIQYVQFTQFRVPRSGWPTVRWISRGGAGLPHEQQT